VIRGPRNVIIRTLNVIMGPWNVNRVPRNVNRGPRNVIIRTLNVIMGPWNVIMGTAM
jgi:hypothetical protein